MKSLGPFLDVGGTGGGGMPRIFEGESGENPAHWRNGPRDFKFEYDVARYEDNIVVAYEVSAAARNRVR